MEGPGVPVPGSCEALPKTDSDHLGEPSVHPVPESEKLMDLLVQSEELRQHGKSATPEELCPDDQALRVLLRERLARRQRLQAALDPPVTRGTSKSPNRRPCR